MSVLMPELTVTLACRIRWGRRCDCSAEVCVEVADGVMVTVGVQLPK